MKITGILNHSISEVIASMGHYQEIVICDAGFPIPPGVKRIDLSLTPGMPAFLVVLKTVLLELCVEEVVIAEETGIHSPARLLDIRNIFSELTPTVIPHTEFKQRSKTAIACIRSGECTPYSNIILVSGVTY
ncbi:D-ribose pyranase [Paenibacillus psychroresistens]|uniref:D-ribose pyranase n=1 Tax=Paenibacillus psychroresistens TaxID=1778678 RepID=A0A6B8RN78_9BACL|nr:D-ribose pyranase [Paenibacillus psychroresistens]QGQ97770.1 D-ribose pyranase [Paenibacillus psychroresistens]